MGELDGPRLGDTVDMDLGVVMDWDLMALTRDTACRSCGQVLGRATAEAVRAGMAQDQFPHDCRPGQYVDPCLAKNLNQSGENNE